MTMGAVINFVAFTRLLRNNLSKRSTLDDSLSVDETDEWDHSSLTAIRELTEKLDRCSSLATFTVRDKNLFYKNRFKFKSRYSYCTFYSLVDLAFVSFSYPTSFSFTVYCYRIPYSLVLIFFLVPFYSVSLSIATAFLIPLLILFLFLFHWG